MTEKLVAGPLRGVREREPAGTEIKRWFCQRCQAWHSIAIPISGCEPTEPLGALASLPSRPPRELTPSELDKCMEDYDCGTIPRGELLTRINAALASPVQGMQARVEAKIKQWRECPCGGPCAEFADSLAEVLK